MPLATAERFTSPLLAAYDVACFAPRHEHADEEVAPHPQVVIPRRGVFRWHIGKMTMLAEPNTVLYFHPGRAHRVTHPVHGGDECTSLHLSLEDLDDAFGDAAVQPRYWVLDRASHRRVHLAVHALRVHPDALACDEAAMTILESLARTPHTRTVRHTRDVESVRERIAADPSERATLLELARGVGLSAFELARRFRAQTGSPIHQYRLRLRLTEAISRLHDGADDISALALELGFADRAHFTIAFRTVFGSTPREIRARGAKGRAGECSRR